jgi:hypothetical protein
VLRTFDPVRVAPGFDPIRSCASLWVNPRIGPFPAAAFGVNRIAIRSPSTGTTITSEGMPITSVGTVSHPTLAAAINCTGAGFQRGTHANWQLVANDGSGAPTLTDMGARFAIAIGGVLTLFIAAPPNGSSVWVCIVDEVSGAVFEQEITADLPAATQFLSPRLFPNTGATAAAVTSDCARIDLETDF